jgi:glycosyltransferase involved in cell wall biosynthesis
MDEVSVVITACGRPDLLKRTIETFLEFNKYPIAKWIISEDSGSLTVNREIMEAYPDFTWLHVTERQGQIKSVDAAYALVETPYVFHLEDDWETYCGGFIEESLAILKNTPNVSAVMVREHTDRVYAMSDTPPYLKCWGQWGHFSMNPGLRRMEDYRTFFNSSYNSFVTFDKSDPLKGEYMLNQFYRNKEYRMALTPNPEGHMRHIGDGRHIGEIVAIKEPLRIGLCMIMKNESHILHESLGCTLPLVDTYCIVDTGSTDNSIEVVKKFYAEHGIVGEVHERPWKDFGTNRSQALALCDGKMDYILVIDADDLMTFPADGRKRLIEILEKEKPNSATIRIRQGSLDYARGQLFKANDGWKYKGVLHEYPTNDGVNKSIELPQDFWMESRRLGARNLTGDKPKRDIEVLLKGVEDEPDNERYVFYLAQSYHDIGDWANSLKWYKKRFKMQRWAEEAWYAAYRVGNCYKNLGDIPKFECWMLRAYAYRPTRAEPLYHLAEYFRIHGQHYKAYQYIQMGRAVSYPTDSLFIEGYPHKGGFEYEASILDYYVNSDKKIGLRSSIKYLLQQGMHIHNVLANMQFYITSIPSTITPLSLPSVFGPDFRPTAISIGLYPYANVRFVNYLPPTDGNYKTKNGESVQTRNAYVNLETGHVIAKMDDSKVADLKVKTEVKGIEDVRLFMRNGTLRFLGCYYDIDINVRMLEGEYNVSESEFIDCRTIVSPLKRKYEKNWLPIPQTDLFIYDWHPLRIGKIVDGELTFPIVVDTPPLFELFRGSTPPRMRNNRLLTMVHMTEYSNPRKYYHLFVELDPVTYKPLRVSLPFVFRSISIEYCISLRLIGNDTAECLTTHMDSNPSKVKIDLKNVEWMDIQSS